MGLVGSDVHIDGAIFHWVAKTDDGIVVVDVWETDEPRCRLLVHRLSVS